MNDSNLEQLQQVIDQAGKYLPAQGQIRLFVNQNTLHAFEELPFDEGVQQAGQAFGCQPYLSEERFREEYERGRIQQRDLEEVLRRELGDDASHQVVDCCSRFELRLAMMRHAFQAGPPSELHWFVAETDALTKFRADVDSCIRQHFLIETRHWVMRDVIGRGGGKGVGRGADKDRRAEYALAGVLDYYNKEIIEKWSDKTWEEFTLQSLWRICRSGVVGLKPAAAAQVNATRHRDLLFAATGEDSDRLVHEVMIRYTGAFLDQGVALWSLPFRELGFFAGFCALYGQPASPPDRWLRGLSAELRTYATEQVSALASIRASLDELGVPESEWEPFLTATLFGLRGWAGMVREIEARSDIATRPVSPGTLVDFLAVYLILECKALRYLAEQALNWKGELKKLREVARLALPADQEDGEQRRAFVIFQLAQVLGWLPEEMFVWSKADWAHLVNEIEAFSEMERRKLYQRAYERHHYTEALDAIAVSAARPTQRVARAGFQIICCMDDREESFRRHIEEVAPESETFGVAGFFSVSMYYRGAADADYAPLCPGMRIPEHWVGEVVARSEEPSHRRRAQTRRALGRATQQIHLNSRTFAGGALLTAGFGVLASLPLVARVLFPRFTSRVRRAAGRLVETPNKTSLVLERSEPEPGPGQGHQGYTVEEMADIAERMLGDCGLTNRLARIVIWTGHGSSSLNNPHHAAYNCGACAGGEGGPNARALAHMLNAPRVREMLAARGIVLPADTVFVGASHNTCDDSVVYYDLDRLPNSHQQEFRHVQTQIEEACNRDAHERCRRFHSAPLNLSFEAARRHVESRAEDLSQARPELGHAGNSLILVGRRERARGLFMDRRAFLATYDPTVDDEEHSILSRILADAVPVCGGINLQYYFSYIDPDGWGCGTKLPHNVSGLIGVMDGPASDLRTGLPWQGVESHEPVRSLFIIETTPEVMLKMMEKKEAIGRMFRHAWVQLALLDPDSSQLLVFRQGKFEAYQPEKTELPEVKNSFQWYRGWRDYLGFALMEDATPSAGKGGLKFGCSQSNERFQSNGQSSGHSDAREPCFGSGQKQESSSDENRAASQAKLHHPEMSRLRARRKVSGTDD